MLVDRFSLLSLAGKTLDLADPSSSMAGVNNGDVFLYGDPQNFEGFGEHSRTMIPSSRALSQSTSATSDLQPSRPAASRV